MAIAGVEKLKRYKQLADLFMEYRSSAMARRSEWDDLPDAQNGDESDSRAEALANRLEEMGPIFVKLGQALSSRSDLLPPAYLKALSRLQDNLEPFSFEEVEKAIEEELG